MSLRTHTCGECAAAPEMDIAGFVSTVDGCAPVLECPACGATRTVD